MKTFNFDLNLVQAAPKMNTIDIAFTDKVMANLPNIQTFSTHIHSKRKQTVWYRFRHLPKFAVVLLALAALFIASTVTYAVVETIKQANVKVEKSGVNEFGRKELTVAFDSCAEQEKNGTTYELKKDSGLSTEDGAKVLQAQCERDAISSWIRKDPALSKETTDPQYGPLELNFTGTVGKFQSLSDEGISIRATPAFTADEQRGRLLPLPKDARIVEAGTVIDRKDLKPGDSLLYFSPDRAKPFAVDAKNIVVFKLNLDAKYYSLDMQSYIRVRKACPGNPSRSCLDSNHINMVTLIVAQTGNAGWQDGQEGRMLEGRVVSWNDNEIKLDVGKGVIYTIQTDSNVIDTYNRSKVYGLASFDNIYAKTDPEDLKIRVGDSLQIGYNEPKGQFSSTITWKQMSGINLMVERKTDNIDMLRKY